MVIGVVEFNDMLDFVNSVVSLIVGNDCYTIVMLCWVLFCVFVRVGLLFGLLNGAAIMLVYFVYLLLFGCYAGWLF